MGEVRARCATHKVQCTLFAAYPRRLGSKTMKATLLVVLSLLASYTFAGARGEGNFEHDDARIGLPNARKQRTSRQSHRCLMQSLSLTMSKHPKVQRQSPQLRLLRPQSASQTLIFRLNFAFGYRDNNRSTLRNSRLWRRRRWCESKTQKSQS